MRLQLFLLLVVPFHPLSNALFHSNQTSLNIELHQCNTNLTLVHNTTFSVNRRFDSCNLNCCTNNQSTSSNTCQVTAQSYTGICLGRLCYRGECDHFFSSMNLTFVPKAKSNLSMGDTIRSSFINPPRLVWPFWRDRSYLSIRYSILIFLLVVNVVCTFITLFLVIKSIRQAQIHAARKLHRYSLF